tara:strand:+ start:78 stop:737 length:660 start_codon:yes stop_codon:yes gene_type:complete
MYLLARPVMASEIAAMFSLSLMGVDRPITKVASVSDMQTGALCFVGGASVPSSKGMIIASAFSSEGVDQNSCIISANPRLDFIRALIDLKRQGLLSDIRQAGNIHESAIIHPTALVEPGAVIGAGVLIEERVVIRDHVYLGDGVRTGAFCVLGSDGFGFERDEQDRPIRFSQFGRAILSEDVEIGCHCCIGRGTLGDTFIGRSVKCDNYVYVSMLRSVC